MKIEGKTALAMVLFVISVFMVMSKFMLPITFQVFIEEQSTYVQEIPNVYTVLDCITIAIFSFLFGVSAFYLLFVGFRIPEKERIERGAEPDEAGSKSTLPVRDADTQVPETSKLSTAPEDNGAELLKILKGNEKRVIEALMKYGEMNQADLSARTGIPKSTLSRILHDLEDRSLIFRYDYGMSKMMKLGSGL